MLVNETRPEEPTSDVPDEFLNWLTKSPGKAAAYRVDPYFRHGARQVSAAAVLPVTFVAIKPDAIAGRRSLTLVDELDRSEFTVLDAWRFRLTPALIRELWRYQYNVASWARVEVVDLLLPSSDSLLLLLRDRRWSPAALPAACRLAARKGSADPSRRKPGDLRALLDAPTPQFNFFHTADEPADVVRELAAVEVALGKPVLGAVAEERTSARVAVEGLIEELYAETPAHDLDCEPSWRRLAVCGDGEIASLARRALRGEGGGWSALLALFREKGTPGELLWDVLAIATAEMPHSLPGSRSVIPTFGADVSAWSGALAV